MDNPLLIAFIGLAATVVIMLAVLVWVLRVNARLKRDLLRLEGIVKVNCNDIAGLCNAAVTVDNRINKTESQFNELWGQLDQYQQQAERNIEESAHPYSGDIRKVRSGASVDELMQSSGLTHDEAALLIRLHGSSQR
ncbi:MAG: DUF2802 domain-containing protein [Methylococcaceae bacterium]|nr:DUF2802 domain-containing protein [Methylococcaceae bacterium]MDP3904547.1 DUF2802 domain-containing protein [Methylococcaceae bacterium]